MPGCLRKCSRLISEQQLQFAGHTDERCILARQEGAQRAGKGCKVYVLFTLDLTCLHVAACRMT
jgi:hypothetical protein